MKKFGVLFLFVFLLIAGLSLSAEEAPRIGVLRFTNQTSAGWWSASVGDELSDMLTSELVSMESFDVLERKEINAVLSEQDLGESGRIDPETKAQLRKIKGARYLIAGTVSSYEENTSGGEGGISFKGIGLGGKKDKAYIAVDVKVIDTTTGQIVDAKTIEANASSSAVGVGLSKGSFSGNLSKYNKTPAGKAIRACIIYIAEYLDCSLVKGKNDPCMDQWRQIEGKRKAKTKKSIKLD